MSLNVRGDDLDDIIEKPISRVKSTEELRCHTIDESLNDFAKANLLLASSNESQIIVGVRLVPNLIRLDRQQCVQKVFPKFKETCLLVDTNRSMEFYETLSSSLLEILAESILTPKEFVNHFIPLIISKANLYCEKPNDYEISVIYQFWTNLIFQIIDYLPENLVKTAIFDTIPHVKLQHLSRRAREYMCNLLAKCAPKLSVQVVKTQLYPILSDLCNDTQYEIRAVACKSLAPVSRALGPDVSSELVLSELFKYLSDESTLVKTASYCTLIEILDQFTNYETKSYLLKKIQSFIEYGMSNRDENYLLAISKSFGTVLNSLNDAMNTQTKMLFVDIFCQLCKNESLFAKRSINESRFNWISCKINLANSFPDILVVISSISFEGKLSQCLSALVRDRNENVRETIMSKFIDIANKLGSSNVHLLINDYCSALNDDSNLVLTATVNHLEKFLSMFIKKESNGILTESQQMPGYQLVLKRLTTLENSISQTYKYNLHSTILDSFSLMPWLISTDNLIEKILPVLESRLNSRALPVRRSCIRSMLIILRKIPQQKVRYTYLNKLLDFSMNKNCYKRAFFVDICTLVLEFYSKNFFKNYFYQSLIQLSSDPIVNVRICFLRILPDLKRLWKFQSDKDKLDNLEQVVKTLLHDKDKDVYDLAQKAILKMDSINVITRNELEDKINRIREEEESNLLDMEPKKFKSPSFNYGQAPAVSQSSGKSARMISKTGGGKVTLTNGHSANRNSNQEFNSKLFQTIDSIRSQTINPLPSIDKNKVKPRRNSVNEFYGGTALYANEAKAATAKKK